MDGGSSACGQVKSDATVADLRRAAANRLGERLGLRLFAQHTASNHATPQTDKFTHWGSKTCDCMGFQRMKLFGPDDPYMFRYCVVVL